MSLVRAMGLEQVRVPRPRHELGSTISCRLWILEGLRIEVCWLLQGSNERDLLASQRPGHHSRMFRKAIPARSSPSHRTMSCPSAHARVWPSESVAGHPAGHRPRLQLTCGDTDTHSVLAGARLARAPERSARLALLLLVTLPATPPPRVPTHATPPASPDLASPVPLAPLALSVLCRPHPRAGR